MKPKSSPKSAKVSVRRKSKAPEVPSWNQEADGGVIGFMCQTDWEHELGAAAGGNGIYPSVEDLRKHRSCVKECGIVKVKVYFEEVMQAQDFSECLKTSKTSKTAKRS